MAKIKFRLLLNGVGVSDVVELQEYCESRQIVDYYRNGQLLEWLEDRDETDISELVRSIDAKRSDAAIYTLLLKKCLNKKEFKAYDDLLDAQAGEPKEDEILNNQSVPRATNGSKVEAGGQKTSTLQDASFYGMNIADIEEAFQKFHSEKEPYRLRLASGEEYLYNILEELAEFPEFANGQMRLIGEAEIKNLGQKRIAELLGLDTSLSEFDDRQIQILIPTSTLCSPTTYLLYSLLDDMFIEQDRFGCFGNKDDSVFILVCSGCDPILVDERLKDVDGAVIDRYTGLMWEFPTEYLVARELDYVEFDVYMWQDFQDAAHDKPFSDLLGYEDWRLPSKAEIISAQAVYELHKRHICDKARQYGKSNGCDSIFWTLEQTDDCQKAYYYDFENNTLSASDKKSGFFSSYAQYSMGVRHIQIDEFDEHFLLGDCE